LFVCVVYIHMNMFVICLQTFMVVYTGVAREDFEDLVEECLRAEFNLEPKNGRNHKR